MPFRILLVDDDKGDRFFFKNALSELSISIQFRNVDGEELMDHLSKNSHELPDVIFLDLNMPCKNGFECLTEIKLSKKFQHIPVIVYSASFDEMVADELYKNGAHYYIQKTNFVELKKILQYVLTIMQEKRSSLPPRNKFMLNITSQV